MRRWILILAVAALAGCGTRGHIQVGGTGVPAATSVPAGTATGGGSVSASIRASSTAAALITIGVLTAVSIESDRGHEAHRSRPAPPLDEARAVNEQDCTRPISDPTANLRCR